MSELLLPRERVALALERKTPDRVPVDFWSVSEVMDNLMRRFNTHVSEDVYRALGIDLRIFGPDYIGPPLRTLPDGSYYGPMGDHRKKVGNRFSVYDEMASYPVGDAATIDDLEKFEYWPNPDHYDYAGLSDKIGDMHERYYIKLYTGGIFELAWELRGLEQFYLDMALDPEIAYYIMGRYADFYSEYIRRSLEAAGDKYDIVYTYDDIASQRGPLMSGDMWRRLVRPHHEKVDGVIKSFGKKVMYHSCGAVYDIIDDLITLPIDILNPIQPAADGMDLAKLKKNYGGRLCFHGGMDIQWLLPHGTKTDVEASVAHTVDTLGKGGGYILASAHALQNDTPVENIVAMYDAARNYRY